MPMPATFTPSERVPSETVLPHTSAISWCGSATISTEPTRAPLTTTGTSRLAIGAAISAANHAGTRLSRLAAPAGGCGQRGEPPASFTTIRTWRTSRNCELRSARNFSAGTSCCMRATASLTSSSASSIEAAISTRVDARAWRIVTAPATNSAITSIPTKTMRSRARTERPCHSACDRVRAGGHASGGSNGIRFSDGARMYVLPMAADLARRPWDGARGNGSLAAILAPQRPRAETHSLTTCAARQEQRQPSRTTEDTRMFLRADKAVPYGEIMEVMSLLRAAGYLKVALVGLEKTP